MTDDEFKRLFESMRQENAAAHAETRRHFETVPEETRRHFETVTEETRRHFETMTEETRRHFETMTEETRHEIRLVAESVVGVNEKLDRESGSIRDEMRHGFAETQAMVKFSHVELDRRVRSLEDAVADLQTRVDRLEDSTH